MRLGRKVRQLWQNGCDVRVGYTIMGRDIGRMMRAPGQRGRVPMRHLVQDVNGDGEFDNYFHIKVDEHRGPHRRRPEQPRAPQRVVELVRPRHRSDENLGVHWRKGLDAAVPEAPRLLVRDFPAFTQRGRTTMSARTSRQDGPGRQRRRAALRDRADQRRRPVRERRPRTEAGGQASARPQASTSGGSSLCAREDRAVDVCFDGRRVWSFWVRRDTEAWPGQASARRRGLAKPLRRFLDGAHRIERPRPRVVRGPTSNEGSLRRRRGADQRRQRAGRPARDRQVGQADADVRRAAAATSPRCRRHPVGSRGPARRRASQPFLGYGTLLGAVREGPCSATTPTPTSAT